MILSPKQLEIFYDSFSASFSLRFNAKKMPDCNLLNIKEIKLKPRQKLQNAIVQNATLRCFYGAALHSGVHNSAFSRFMVIMNP